MVDQRMGARSAENDILVDPAYSSDQAVEGFRTFGAEDAQNLAVLFPPWHGGGPVFDHLAKRLARSGYAVRSYDFNDHIMEPDVDGVLDSFKRIENTVTSELDELQDEKGYARIHFIGASLGSVSLARVARRFPSMSEATLVVGGSNLAMSMWHGSRTQKLRHMLEEQGVDAPTLDDAWHDLAPMTNAAAFKDKPVRHIVSSTDEIIPTKYQRELTTALRSAGSIVRPQYTRAGHYASVGAYCLMRRLP